MVQVDNKGKGVYKKAQIWKYTSENLRFPFVNNILFMLRSMFILYTPFMFCWLSIFGLIFVKFSLINVGWSYILL